MAGEFMRWRILSLKTSPYVQRDASREWTVNKPRETSEAELEARIVRFGRFELAVL